MNKLILTLISSTAIAALPACRAAQQSGTPEPVEVDIDRPLTVTGWNSAKTYPKAVIYKTNGNFADKVPVTLSNDRKSIIAYPAPSDVRNQQPVALAEGFYLDRRGISPNSAFTRYTYAEYAAMAKAPGARQLKEAIIPGAIVTEIVELPFPVGQATPQQCDSLINAGLPRCKTVYKIDAVMIGPENI